MSALKLAGSGLRNGSLQVVLTPVRVFASVKERCASPLQDGGPADFTTREPIAQRDHHAHYGLWNE
jgi:hypothetical protein